MITVNKASMQKGNTILAVLSMAVLSSIALFTMMFSIKSLSRTLTLETVQNSAQQLLLIENDKTIDNYIQTLAFTDVSSNSLIIANGIEYTYRQYPQATQNLSMPLTGYSINSNYASTLVNFKSQITRENIQTPALHAGIACIDIVSEELNSNLMKSYELGFAAPISSSTSYEFNSKTGEIWRNSATASKLIIDFGFESSQIFSHADFAMINIGNKTKLALVFAVIETVKSGLNHQNNLYVLFDQIDFDQTIFPPVSRDQFITLTQDYSPTGHEDGFILPLGVQQIQLSAITTIQHTIIFITQVNQADPLTGQITLQNTLYQINLSPVSNQTSKSMVKTRLLSTTEQAVN